MTREQLISLLQEGGWENPSKLAINSILNGFAEEKKAAIEASKAEVREEYKDFKSKEDFEKLENEISTLKDAGAKNERIGKLKAKGIQDKYVEFADGVLKGSKNFDKDLDKYFADYPEQFTSAQKKEEPKEHTFENMGDGGKPNQDRDAVWNDTFLKALS